MATLNLEISHGKPEPLGLSLYGDRFNFAIFSHHATQVKLGLFWNKEVQEIPLNRTGDIWHVAVKGIPEKVTYAYKCEGPSELLYNPTHWLADPYAKIPAGFIKTDVALPPQFDWQGVTPPEIAPEDLIIYETHVRGFTKDPSSKCSKPGTYLGFIEKIPYLKKLGVNAIELLPIFEFDETYLKKAPLVNYWGYNSTHFFAPKRWYAESDPISEFKTLVRELHRNGILVLLDVPYNHTGEGKVKDYAINFRGIDNSIYYLLEKDGSYSDFAGCGNTFNVNHPIVRKLILDSLRYWVCEMHVDGFRFDLASIFTRGTDGKPIAHPPIIDEITNDPILKNVKLIAEAWDAAGLYQLGHFAKYHRWAEWNGRYRDIVRRFIKGTDGKVGKFAEALSGSETLYRTSKTPLSSINFITAHDGFTLRDLVTYQDKHNLANGENNLDGSNQNDNWNCGHEGPTDDAQILALRERQMRNFLLALFVSQGTPMLLMGDEYGHTRRGNNNPYVQDNEINWFLWDRPNQKITNFVSSLIAFRKKHAQLRRNRFLTDEDVEWFANWDDPSRLISFWLKPSLYIAFNAHYEPKQIDLPQGKWQLIVNTNEDWQFHSNGPLISSVSLTPYSSLLAIHIP